MKKFRVHTAYTISFLNPLKMFFLAGCVFFFSVFSAAAQSEVIAVLEYCDYPDQLQITDSDGFVVREAYFGMDLGTGDTLRTAGTAAEIRLTRSGSIIRLAPDTHFRIDSLAGSRGENTNAFSLEEGKMRGVASGAADGGLVITTPSGVCAAEGADFAVSAIGGFFDGAAVKAGSVSFTKTAARKTITIPEANAADALGEDFRPEVYPPQKIEEIFYDLEFVMLEPDGLVRIAAADPAPPAAALPAVKGEEPQYAEDFPGGPAGLMRKYLAMNVEIGALTVDRRTYSLLIAEPSLTIGRFSMGLYLPLIFSGNITSPSDRLRPRGNNEWDFGKHVDQDYHRDSLRKDFLRDLALKLHFIEYGQPGDSLFVKAGNFREMTLGHGSLMYKYANDADFPILRRVGLHMGLNAEGGGLEIVGADIAESDIFGGRAFVRPFASLPLNFGISAVMDKHPMYSLSDAMIAAYPAGQSPRDVDFLMNGFALDMDMPLLKKDSSSLTLFADAATLIPALRSEYLNSKLGNTIGFLSDAFYDESYAGKIRNYGLSAGAFGSSESLDYRMELRQYKGIFRPGFFGANYDRLRGLYAGTLLDYIANPEASAYTATTIAFYGEAGIHIRDKLRLSAGYLLPAKKNGTTLDDDYLEIRLKMEKGLIPLPILDKLSFSFDYIQHFFAPIFRDLVKGRHTEFIDGRTILKTEAAYEVNEAVDLSLFLSTAARRDTGGYILYDTDFLPDWIYVFGMQARLKM